MIVVKLKGGLGNQMFQYATGLEVVSVCSQTLKLDITGYDDPRYVTADTPRQYRMFPFNLSAVIATPDEVKSYKYPFGIFSKAMRFFNFRILKRYYVDYDPNFFKKSHNYIEGYFQSEKNFIDVKDKVFKEFALKKELESEVFLTEKNKIDKTRSVSVHIRRGDYVSDPKTNIAHGLCSKEYYEKTINLIKAKVESPVFYFFSDDIDWVKKEFGEHSDFRYVSNPTLQDYEELVLMSSCAHNIIANSSFSWWGAYLNQNPNKIVIAPKKWVNKEPDPQPNIIPEGWVRI
ncbi:MAG: alpha-1,2-fucosyltransferase [Patescibacteria group bacterium]